MAVRAYRLRGITHSRFEGGRLTRYRPGEIIRMDDKEASKFRLNREIVPVDTAPKDERDLEPVPEPIANRPDREVDRDRIHALLADARSTQPAEFRKDVVEAGVLETVPRAHVDIVAALEALVTE